VLCVLQYYDIPSPSLRDAVYAEMRADLAPFKACCCLCCAALLLWRRINQEQSVGSSVLACPATLFCHVLFCADVCFTCSVVAPHFPACCRCAGVQGADLLLGAPQLGQEDRAGGGG
jgi:hypothetical protein